ncbi:MAG: type II toxin-antitoxin system RelE/ParE family toxin [Deltaproteobacteria bacterium]|nr:type II toxin-antitoxin system RelE/ParE family toxin [Deltaproteobacteria bacterium]
MLPKDRLSLGGGLFELRVRSYRVFFCFKPGNRIVLLHAFSCATIAILL